MVNALRSANLPAAAPNYRYPHLRSKPQLSCPGWSQPQVGGRQAKTKEPASARARRRGWRYSSGRFFPLPASARSSAASSPLAPVYFPPACSPRPAPPPPSLGSCLGPVLWPRQPRGAMGSGCVRSWRQRRRLRRCTRSRCPRSTLLPMSRS